MPAQTKPVTISPAAAAAAGCTATCTEMAHDAGTAYDYTYFRLAAAAAAGWRFVRFDWTLKWHYEPASAGSEGSWDSTTNENPHPRSAAVADWDNALLEGWISAVGASWRELYEIATPTAVFERNIVQRPFLVYADQAGKLVRTDGGSLMNEM